MSWIEQLANSNMPGAIAMITLILFIAAFMVFVLPMIKENEALKTRNTDLEQSHKDILDVTENILHTVERLAHTDEKIEVDHNLLKEGIDHCNNDTKIQLDRIEELLHKTNEGLTGKDTVQALVESVKSNLRELHIEDQAKLAMILSALNNIKQVNEDIKDRQSTLNGALLLANNSNRGLK